MRKVGILLLIGLVFAIGILLLTTDGGIKQTDPVKPPLAFRWYPVSGAFTPEARMLEFDSSWLNR